MWQSQWHYRYVGLYSDSGSWWQETWTTVTERARSKDQNLRALTKECACGVEIGGTAWEWMKGPPPPMDKRESRGPGPDDRLVGEWWDRFTRMTCAAAPETTMVPGRPTSQRKNRTSTARAAAAKSEQRSTVCLPGQNGASGPSERSLASSSSLDGSPHPKLRLLVNNKSNTQFAYL